MQNFTPLLFPTKKSAFATAVPARTHAAVVNSTKVGKSDFGAMFDR